MQHIMKAAAAGIVSVAAANSVSARDEVPATDSQIGVTGAFSSGCTMLSGNCDGARQSIAMRFGNTAERRELVVSAGTFIETTSGGYYRSFPVTHRGERLAELDFSLSGGLSVRGKTLSVDKSYPLGDHGVLQVGGFVGQITGRAEAKAESALTVVRPALHYAVSQGQVVEQVATFGGVRQSMGIYMPMSSNVALLAQQHFVAGLDKVQVGVGIGTAYFADPGDRAGMRPDGCGVQMQAAKGLVLAMQLCASEILYDKLGQALDGKFSALANRVNGYTARTEQYGYTLPTVTGAPFARLVGYELSPRRVQSVNVMVAVPLGKATYFTAAVRREAFQTSRTASLTHQF